jgi:hypothetical protein
VDGSRRPTRQRPRRTWGWDPHADSASRRVPARTPGASGCCARTPRRPAGTRDGRGWRESARCARRAERRPPSPSDRRSPYPDRHGWGRCTRSRTRRAASARRPRR